MAISLVVIKIPNIVQTSRAPWVENRDSPPLLLAVCNGSTVILDELGAAVSGFPAEL